MNEPIQKRLKDKFTQLPKWADDFSIEVSQDKDVSRRDFIRFMSLVSFGLLTGTAGVFLRSIFSHEKPVQTGVRIMNHGDLAVGESRSFMIPGKKEPGILVRLGDEKYVAYGQKCTHLQCPVLWDKGEQKLLCPCHKGAFAIEDGRVLYGPPERALPALEVGIEDGGIYFHGVKSGNFV